MKLSHILIIEIFLLYFYGATIFLSLIVRNIYSSTKINYFESIIQNLSKFPIIDIKQRNNFKCDPEYSTLNLGYWPGLSAGCDCSYFADDIFKKECSSNLKNLCITLREIKGSNYYVWKGISFCVKYYKYNYKNITITRSNEDCPNKYRKCGKIDSLGNLLCVEEDLKCPLNYFKISNQTISNYTSSIIKFQLENNEFAYFSNEYIEQDILLDFKITESLPCVDPSEESYDKDPYILEKNNVKSCQTNYGQQYKDSRYSVIDSFNYYDLLKNNSLSIYYDNNSPENNRLKYLFERPYIGFNFTCRKELNFKLRKDISTVFKDILKDFEIILYFHWYFTLLSYIMLLNGVIVFFGTLIIFANIDSLTIRMKKLKIFFQVLITILKIMFFVLFVFFFLKIFDMKVFLSILTNGECFDSITKFAVQEFMTNIENILAIYFCLFLSNLVDIILIFIVFKFSYNNEYIIIQDEKEMKIVGISNFSEIELSKKSAVIQNLNKI